MAAMAAVVAVAAVATAVDVFPTFFALVAPKSPHHHLYHHFLFEDIVVFLFTAEITHRHLGCSSFPSSPHACALICCR
jgi:hypothetical protein